MRRSQPIAILAVAVLALPPASAAASTPGELLATAAPLSRSTPLARVAPSLSRVPIASTEIADLMAATPDEAGELLAQAPPATATPPARLPRTGADVWLVLLAGGGLMLTGAGLRMRLPAPAPAPASR